MIALLTLLAKKPKDSEEEEDDAEEEEGEDELGDALEESIEAWVYPRPLLDHRYT